MTDIEKRAAEAYKEYLQSPSTDDVKTDEFTYAMGFIKGSSEGYEKGKVDKWISVKDRLPTAYEPGEWDGLRSDFVLTKNKKGHAEVARVYTGILDGDKFANWFTTDDYELEGVTQWREIN
jgi:hypothetical protein